MSEASSEKTIPSPYPDCLPQVMPHDTPSSTLSGTPVESDMKLIEGSAAAAAATTTARKQTIPNLSSNSINHHEADLEKAAEREAISTTTPSDDFEVKFTGDTDPRSVRSLSTLRKWLILIIVSTSSLCVACVSSIYTETTGQITNDFDCSDIVATLGLSFFVLGLGLSPMLLGPLSEFYGRKPIYIGSLVFFFIWIIPCAVAQNIQTLIVVRFFDGFSGAAFLSVAASTAGDLFPKDKLALPMAVYTLTPFLGPQVGPILGGFINYYANWRWTFWVVLIWTGVQMTLVILFVPETYHPVLVRNEARRLRKETGDVRYFAPIEKIDRSVSRTIVQSCYRPFLLLFLEPMCFFLCLYSSLLLGILYLFFGAFDLVFENNHGFTLWETGLSFLGITIGMIIGTCAVPLFTKNHRRLLAKHEAETGSPGSEPEYRLPPMMVGAPLVTVGLMWFGWTTYKSVPWIVPIIGSAFFGAGVILAFSGIWTFLVESYPLYAASAMAANSFARSLFAAAFPLFGIPMYKNLGYQWATFILAMISLVMVPFPFIFYRYGRLIRSKSRYAGQR